MNVRIGLSELLAWRRDFCGKLLEAFIELFGYSLFEGEAAVRELSSRWGDGLWFWREVIVGSKGSR